MKDRGLLVREKYRSSVGVAGVGVRENGMLEIEMMVWLSVTTRLKQGSANYRPQAKSTCCMWGPSFIGIQSYLWYNKKSIWSFSPVLGTERLKPLESPE